MEEFDNRPIIIDEVLPSSPSHEEPSAVTVQSEENVVQIAAAQPDADTSPSPSGEEQPSAASEQEEVSKPEETHEEVAEAPAAAEEAAPVASETPDVASLLAQIAELKAQNELLRKLFEEKIAIDEHKNQLFDKMYAELAQYKQDLHSKLLKPFVMATIGLIDETTTFLGKLEENESKAAEKYLRDIPDDLLYILETNGVDTYVDEVDKFNPKTQRALRQVSTDKPELDNMIAKRIRPGYSWKGVNLKPEMVAIYKYKPENN